ncbi:hypothetical protein N752_29005 [Desulforamulus aquiferis]|nr:hypothetical protein N752_29005 [Desulforamulus aquiferis]
MQRKKGNFYVIFALEKLLVVLTGKNGRLKISAKPRWI